MGDVESIPIHDELGLFKNLNELMKEARNNNIEALAVAYTRKEDGSTRTYRHNFDRYVLIGLFEQMKFDCLHDNSDSEVIHYE